MTNKTFLKITNKDIYNEIKSLKKENYDAHEDIIKRQNTTNGKVSVNRWISTTALTIALMVIGWLIATFVK